MAVTWLNEGGQVGGAAPASLPPAPVWQLEQVHRLLHPKASPEQMGRLREREACVKPSSELIAETRFSNQRFPDLQLSLFATVLHQLFLAPVWKMWKITEQNVA